VSTGTLLTNSLDQNFKAYLYQNVMDPISALSYSRYGEGSQKGGKGGSIEWFIDGKN
jgi:hypothetical protein